MHVSESSIPAAKPWRERSNTLAHFPGGAQGQKEMLRQVLGQLPSPGEAMLTLTPSEGEALTGSCEDLCRRVLSAPGLAVRAEDGSWHPSSYAREWLENKDDLFLAAHLHANVKFFGELLLSIGDQTKQTDLQEAANSTYGLNWATVGPVRDRTGWLRSLGLLELWNYRVVRTEQGDHLVNVLPLCLPEAARGERLGGAEPAGPQPEQIVSLASSQQLEQSDLHNRRALIGYIPKGSASAGRGQEPLSANAAVRKLIALLGDGRQLDELGELCGNAFGISRNSFASTMQTLRHTGLIEQATFNYFVPAKEAPQLVSEGSELRLAVYLHARYQFFCEILLHLDKPATTSELVSLAKDTYGYAQATNSEVRLRLAFLQEAGLVERVDWQRFRVTASGRSLAQHLPLQQPVTPQAPQTEPDEPQSTTAIPVHESVATRLIQYGNSGTHSRDFEQAVAAAFAFLGFQTEHLGGAGRTDVLATAQLPGKDRYRIIIDAKSSGKDEVGVSSVNFDILRDHQRKHKADHVIVVGPEFAPRLNDWAAEHEIIMLRIAELIPLLTRHAQNPIALAELHDALARSESFTDDLDERYQAIERRSLLLRRIIDLAHQEAVDEDPIAEGGISTENIVYALRKEFTPRPSLQEVEELVTFLSSPMVAALEPSKSRHKLADAPRNIALRLSGLGNAIDAD
ncbi:hypothetical protein RB200_06125 [Streptomyces sp. PmtG]